MNRRSLARLRRNPLLIVGAGLLAALLALAVVGPVLLRDPYESDLSVALQLPSSRYLLGTDVLGRDVLARAVTGARISLLVSLCVVGIGTGLGVPLGALAGFLGGRVDRVLTGFIDVLLALPYVLLAIAIVAILGPGLVNSIIAVGLSYVPEFARVARAQVLSIVAQPYVEAAHGVGASSGQILWRHVIPNAFRPLLVAATLRIPISILVTAGLSFIGMGAQPPLAEWGIMIADSRNYLRAAPHTVIGPGLALMIAVLGFNLFGEGLNQATSHDAH